MQLLIHFGSKEQHSAISAVSFVFALFISMCFKNKKNEPNHSSFLLTCRPGVSKCTRPTLHLHDDLDWPFFFLVAVSYQFKSPSLYTIEIKTQFRFLKMYSVSLGGRVMLHMPRLELMKQAGFGSANIANDKDVSFQIEKDRWTQTASRKMDTAVLFCAVQWKCYLSDTQTGKGI